MSASNADALKNAERQLHSLAHIVTRGAEIHPERLAIDDLLTGQTRTYGELDKRVSQLARALQTQGVAKGDFVAVMLWNETAFVETMFATARMGAVLVPLNLRLLPDEVADYANFHGCKAIVTNADHAEKFATTEGDVRICVSAAKAGGDWLDYETLIAAESDGTMPVVTSLDDPLRMVSTGGTTGRSKGVIHSQVGVMFTVLSVIAEYGVQRGWQTILVLPLYHAAGMDWGMLPILWRTGTVVLPADTAFNAEAYLREVRDRQVEYVQIVPAVINPLYDAAGGNPVTGPKSVIPTSAPTPPALRQMLAEIFPEANLMAAAGLSETLNMATQAEGEFLVEPSAVGEPHIDTRALIVDEDDNEVPRGTPGEIILRNFNTALRYHKNDEVGAVTWRTRKGDPEGLEWTYTGDVGVMDDHGRISIVDRSKDVIITGGETVPSVEVESVFLEHEAVRECAAVGVEDPRWGEAIVLVAAPEDPNIDRALLAQDLFAHGRAGLAGYKVPKRIAFMDVLPRSHFGKVLKRDLREMTFDEAFEPKK